ncbi:hypothetical protein [Nocardioides sp. B-3]|nr:hypothetical protein [Nocardioides sp. B-3]UUZ59476.1 hypothetical protein LP418_27475 [Nocardioides sp. B-3]
MKFFRGSAAAADSYVEADHSRADDYYLGRRHRSGRALPRNPGHGAASR